MSLLKSFRSLLLRCHSMWRLRKDGIINKKNIYLTFDDGPDSDITEFVLDELKKYNAKATFFCVGKNVKQYPTLYRKILEDGHSIGCHTYSHIHGHKTSKNQYLSDVASFETLAETKLFRPPWGALTIKLYLSLIKKYQIVLWHLSSDDYLLDGFNLQKSFNKLKKGTKPGIIILFHFCTRHEKETRQILPLYLEFLNENNYKMLSL